MVRVAVNSPDPEGDLFRELSGRIGVADEEGTDSRRIIIGSAEVARVFGQREPLPLEERYVAD